MFSSFPSNGRKAPHSRGFNLLELIVVMGVMGLLVAVMFPSLSRILQREKIEGFLRQVNLDLERAKSESAKRSHPAIVRADYTNNAIFGFIDLDRDDQLTAGEPQLFYDVLPALGDNSRRLRFWAADEAAPEGDKAVLGFSTDPTPGDPPPQAVFLPDGSIRDSGAFRFGILSGSSANFYELRVEPAATGRVQLRKYLTTPSPAAYRGRNADSNSATWPWY